MSIQRKSLIALVATALMSLSFSTGYAENSSSTDRNNFSHAGTNREDGSAPESVGARANLGGHTHFDYQGHADGAFFPTRAARLQPAQGSGNITNHGGAIISSPDIYLIYYGSWSSPCAATGSSTPNVINTFIRGLGSSAWYKTNTTYYATSGSTKTFVSPTVTYSGCSSISSTTFGTTLDNSAGHLISDIVKNQIAANNWPDDANGIYIVLTSAGIVVTESLNSTFLTNYCGWHSNFTSAAGHTLLDAFIGDGANSSACSAFGGATTSPNNNPTADAMASVIAHEIVETASDPLGNTWYDNSGYENGDKCAWIFSTGSAGQGTLGNGSLYNTTQSGVSYYLQENVAANLNNCVSAFPSKLNSITSVSPSSSVPGGSVTISGGNFSPTNFVFINGVAAAVTAQSATSITVTLPASASTGPLTVVSDYGVSSTPLTITVPAPTITSVSPTNAAIGATITIAGTNLAGTSLVTFGGAVTAVPITASATSVTVRIPVGATTGSISLTTPGGSATSSTALTIVVLPAITGLSPSTIIQSGVTGSTTVTLTGTNLTGSTSVTLTPTRGATTRLTVISSSQTSATFAVPKTQTASTYSVQITNAVGISAKAATSLVIR